MRKIDHSPRQATEVDKIIGTNIRMFRKNRDMTQVELAEQLGVKFQQLQKYETGANRVAASRLLEIALALRVSVMDMLDGTIGKSKFEPVEKTAIGQKVMREMIKLSDNAQKDVLKIVRAMSK